MVLPETRLLGAKANPNSLSYSKGRSLRETGGQDMGSLTVKGVMRAGARMVLLGTIITLCFSLSSCSGEPSGGSAIVNSTSPVPERTTTPVLQGTTTPHPLVTNVNGSTAGFYDDYYVILDATIQNEGAAGSVLVIASITQADNTSTKRMPLFLEKKESQVGRFVFPIKWQGGKWTPKVTVEVP